MTSDRPYRAALPWEVAMAELNRYRGAQFDPRVVDAFERLVADGTLRRPAERQAVGQGEARERVARIARAVGRRPDGASVAGDSLAS
jgi:HD-GYP domain-containing protein (c-di-GMP phosphodiesterase class II)